MSHSLTHTLVCPACGHVQEFTAWASIDPATDPALRVALLDGKLEMLGCAACQVATRVAFDTLYHDSRRGFMIWLCHQSERLEPPDPRVPATYRFRIVRSVPSLVEKIRIFEDQIDDRLIELFKVNLWSSLTPKQREPDGRLYYAGALLPGDPRMEFIIVRSNGTDRLLISRTEQFQPFARRVADLVQVPLVPHTWWLINEEYAVAELTRQR